MGVYYLVVEVDDELIADCRLDDEPEEPADTLARELLSALEWDHPGRAAILYAGATPPEGNPNAVREQIR